MKRRPASFLLILFACLQCLAPLLHAHAAAEGHGGVHLPGWTHPTAQGQEGVAGEGHAHEQEAIGVASSLESRLDGLPPEGPVLVGRLPVSPHAHGLARPQREGPAAPPRFSYLVPDACAPPRA